MHKESVVDMGTGNKKGILKMKNNEHEPATLNEINNYQSMPSGAPKNIEQLPNAEPAGCYTDRRRKNVRDFRTKFKPPFFRRGCSKHCTGYRKDLDTSRFRLQ